MNYCLIPVGVWLEFRSNPAAQLDMHDARWDRNLAKQPTISAFFDQNVNV